ncbi:MAG: aminoglycoside phosphotransferase family protein, partial [Myxococcales bacterium]|nr:aminoglycoside phosphotransferase family protein [Myxococcales bacterium]
MHASGLRWDDVSMPHGQATVLRARVGQTPIAFLKCHRAAASFTLEFYALRTWGPSLQPDVPTLLAVEPQDKVLLLSPLPGRTEVFDTPPDLQDLPRRQAIARASGAFLARLHALPLPDSDERPLREVLPLRAKSWGAQAQGLIDDRTIAKAVERVSEMADGDWGRVPCHRDYSPRNWLIGPGDPFRFSVIDFGHSKADTWLYDVIRLVDGSHGFGEPEMQAFWEGYGRHPNKAELGLLDGLLWLHALGTLVWA